MTSENNQLHYAMMALRDESKVAILSSFFKSGPGQYGEGDVFLGIKVPQTRAVVSQCAGSATFGDLEECINSPYHEMRLAALLALVHIFKHAKKAPDLQKQCVEFYLAHTSRVNNWDLVDLSCYELLGNWLLDKDRQLLYTLASDGHSLWEKRIAVVSTMTFLRHGQLDDTFAIAKLLLGESHDLLHKAIGWLLREAGKRDTARLRAFLLSHKNTMARTTLRYAIEHLPEAERHSWLRK